MSVYLDSILISHFKSGFCILEFDVNDTNKSLNARIVKSSGDVFDRAAIQTLEKMRKSFGNININDSKRPVRLPVFFKNRSL
tara:strand:- start:215 stop:460 length:246 start_codon:yes stop_codon:yes gene_type:complete